MGQAADYGHNRGFVKLNLSENEGAVNQDTLGGALTGRFGEPEPINVGLNNIRNGNEQEMRAI